MPETEDIVTRLREFGCCLVSHPVANGTIERTEEAGELLIQAATTIATLRAEVEGLRADAERLDLLEGEYERERQAILNHRPMPDSLFRMNMPITRAAIDAVKAGKEA